jgi:creatinine amidohydrolase
MQIADMTWMGVDALDRSTVVIAPFGAMEQHGPHLPMQTDALIAAELAGRLDAAHGGRLLVLPAQWLGLSLHHIDFSGTLSASVDTYINMAAEILGSIAQAGFRKIIALNAHGGNVSALDVALTKCRVQHPEARIIHVTYWNVARAALAELRESAIGGMGHACELETSLVLSLNPALVRQDKVMPDGQWSVAPFFAQDMLVGGAATTARWFKEISGNGGVGDPRTASADKGSRFFDAIVRELSKVVTAFESGEVDHFRRVGV